MRIDLLHQAQSVLKSKALTGVVAACRPVAAYLRGARERVEGHAFEIRVVKTSADGQRLGGTRPGRRQVVGRRRVRAPDHPKWIEGVGGQVSSQQPLVRHPLRKPGRVLSKS